MLLLCFRHSFSTPMIKSAKKQRHPASLTYDSWVLSIAPVLRQQLAGRRAEDLQGRLIAEQRVVEGRPAAGAQRHDRLAPVQVHGANAQRVAVVLHSRQEQGLVWVRFGAKTKLELSTSGFREGDR